MFNSELTLKRAFDLFFFWVQNPGKRLDLAGNFFPTVTSAYYDPLGFDGMTHAAMSFVYELAQMIPEWRRRSIVMYDVRETLQTWCDSVKEYVDPELLVYSDGTSVVTDDNRKSLWFALNAEMAPESAANRIGHLRRAKRRALKAIRHGKLTDLGGALDRSLAYEVRRHWRKLDRAHL